MNITHVNLHSDTIKNTAKRKLKLLIVLLATTSVSAETVQWNRPDIDQWFYPANISPGNRVLGPTFGYVGGTGTELDPARRGATLIGFHTSTLIEMGLASHRYEIHSITMTLTNAPGNDNIIYDTTYDTIDALTSGDDDPGRPIELYGLGFRDDYDSHYERLGFGATDHQPPEFEEGTSLYSSGTGAYDLFPLGDDGNGNLTDVYNSSAGGYNAMEPGPMEAWDTSPWAIGKVEGLQPGASVPFESTYEFDIDLELPNVKAHLQRSLSEGSLGLFVSSLHQPDGHTGAVAYPQWYMKEHPLGTPATLVVDLTILPDSLPGDFNSDGVLNLADVNQLIDQLAAGHHDPQFDVNEDDTINSLDLSYWVTELKQTWMGDANLDGQFDSTDLVDVFQAGLYEADAIAGWHEGDWTGDQRFGSTDLVAAFQTGAYELEPEAAESAAAIPEPSTVTGLALACIALAGAQRRKRSWFEMS